MRGTRDFTLFTLREALAETVAWFPVYRTYVTDRGVSPQDERYIDWALSRARRASRVADPSVFDFLRALLTASPPPGATAQLRDDYLDFAMRVQQFTSPVAAKGVEDTAFYAHTRFVSLNDVGGEPSHFGMTRRAFHRVISDRASAWPHTLLATSTHDSKRSEDVRARLDVISEVPAAWRLLVRRWSRLNRSRKSEVDGAAAPSRNDEYLLYQTLVGSFPPEGCEGEALDAYRERIVAYMIKAAREAKLRTSWLRNDAGYEGALTAFVEALLAARTDNRFLDDLRTQSASIAWFGMLNSITLALVKACAPGVPDVYQGNELVDYSLVDPDNRRPVDYAKRRTLLDALLRDADRDLPGTVRRLFESDPDGRAKLWTLARILRYRTAHRELFDDGDYRPMAATGERARHVLAFARTRNAHGLVAVGGRLFASIGIDPHALPLGEAVWGDTTLDAVAPESTSVTNLLTGETVAGDNGRWKLSRLFASFPGAVLVW
jgi:(1->4)-alpha-D-glucan 1-alpha-D-glucosylmutase